MGGGGAIEEPSSQMITQAKTPMNERVTHVTQITIYGILRRRHERQNRGERAQIVESIPPAAAVHNAEVADQSVLDYWILTS